LVQQAGAVPPGGFAAAPPGFRPGTGPTTAPAQTPTLATLPPPPPRFPGSPQQAQPLVRAKGDDEPVARAQPVSLPSPDQLGVGRRSADNVDWVETHRRLQELGAVGFQLEPAHNGGFCFACLLPSAQPDRPFRVEGQGMTQSEAVRLALARAGSYKRSRG
jgi:hypothetical protein